MNVKKAIEKAFQFLESQSKNGFYRCQLSIDRSMTNPKYSPREIASSALVLGTTFPHNLHPNQEIINYLKKHLRGDKSISFFEDPKLLPTDADTTSYTLSVLIRSGNLTINETREIAKKIIGNKNKGEIQVYFNSEESNRENRFDEVALCNILYFLFQQNFEHEAEKHLPTIKDFKWELPDCRFLANPIDLITFNGLSKNNMTSISFIEVKTGKARLTSGQKMIKEAISDKKVKYMEYK